MVSKDLRAFPSGVLLVPLATLPYTQAPLETSASEKVQPHLRLSIQRGRPLRIRPTERCLGSTVLVLPRGRFLAWPRAPWLQNCQPSRGQARPGHTGCCTAPRPLPCRCQDGCLKQPPDSAHHPALRTRTSVPGGSSVLPPHTGSRPALGVARPRQGRQTSTKATQEVRSGVLAGGSGNPRRADAAGRVRGDQEHTGQGQRGREEAAIATVGRGAACGQGLTSEPLPISGSSNSPTSNFSSGPGSSLFPREATA